MTETNLVKFSLTSEKNGNGSESLVLRKNGNVCSCSFRNPTVLPHPSIQGQMIIQNPICSDLCQFFTIKEENPVGAVINLSCSQKTDFIALIEKEKKSDHTCPEGTNLLII
jgi:hypothetical protein